MGRLERSAVVVAAAALSLTAPAVASADETLPHPAPAPATAPPTEQHNVTYRARVDGVARGALVTYRISDTQVNTADPTMLPGRTFETTAVLSDPKQAGMRVSIQWPYGANLHCDILVDDQLQVQADQFISPRLTPARDDPDYGAMSCGAPLSNATGAPMPAAPLPGEPAGTPPADGGAGAAPAAVPPVGTGTGEMPPMDALPTDPPADAPSAGAPDAPAN